MHQDPRNLRRVLADPEDPISRTRAALDARRVGDVPDPFMLRYDREAWNRADNWARQAAFDEVLRELEGDDPGCWEAVELRPYSGFGVENWVGRVLHRASRAIAHFIPGGTFAMGSNLSPRDQPIHEVRVKPFLLFQTPITQDEWLRVRPGENPAYHKGERNPIESVSLTTVEEWLAAAGGRLELPSEAQWEYAARAGTQFQRYYWGDGDNFDHAWLAENSGGRTHSVDEHRDASAVNQFGLVDIWGNVWEWCADDWHENYNGAPSDCRAWRDE